jgi:hypothetical protein
MLETLSSQIIDEVDDVGKNDEDDDDNDNGDAALWCDDGQQSTRLSAIVYDSTATALKDVVLPSPGKKVGKRTCSVLRLPEIRTVWPPPSLLLHDAVFVCISQLGIVHHYR